MSRTRNRRIRESQELFGAPPDQPRFDALAAALRSVACGPKQERDLRTALATAEALEGDLYADLLDPAFDIMGKGVDLDALTDFFHRAAAFGEARHASRLLSEMDLVMLAQTVPPRLGSVTQATAAPEGPPSLTTAMRFNEAEELFGALPIDPSVEGLAILLFARARTAEAHLEQATACVATSDQVMGDLYGEMLPVAFDVAVQMKGDGFALAGDLFHKAAAFGEARMLARLAVVAQARALRACPPHGTT